MATLKSWPSLDGPSNMGNCQVSWPVNKGYISLNHVSTATPYKLLHYYYRATLLMPGVSAVPEVTPLKGLPNRLSLSMMRLKKCLYPLFSYLFNLTIH